MSARIDSHVHFWLMRDRAGEWPPASLAAIHRDHLPPMLAPLLQTHAVDGVVLVQSLGRETDTRFMLELAARTPWIRAVVGWTDLKAPDAPARIARLAGSPLLRGLRPMLADLSDDNWIDDPGLAPGAAAMCRHRLVLDALVQPRHLPALLRFAQRHPGLPVVIDHAAKPQFGQALDAWHTSMAALAALPQVHCKLSGLVTEAGPGWRWRDLAPVVDRVLALFGTERVLWGSDWPVLNVVADYRQWQDATASLLAGLEPTARERILGANAARLYRL